MAFRPRPFKCNTNTVIVHEGGRMTGLTELVFGLMIIGSLTAVIVTSAVLLARKEGSGV